MVNNDLHIPYKVTSTQWLAQSFTSSQSGSWGSSPSWSWNPAGGVFGNPSDNDSISGSLQQMPVGKPYRDLDGNWRGGSSSPGAHTVTYTLEDKNGDGAKATAKYELKLHDQFEEIPGIYSVVDLMENPRRLGGPILGPGDPGGSKTQEVSYSMGVSFSGAPAKWMADVLGISVEGSYTDTTSVTQSITGLPLAANQMTYVQAPERVMDFSWLRGRRSIV